MLNRRLSASTANILHTSPHSKMSNSLLLWETWHRWQGTSLSLIDEVNNLLDSQRRFQSMLKDNDVFYSRTDLRMFIDKCRADALSKLLSAFSDVDEASGQNYILHAAAKLKVSPLNTAQLIKDYPELVHHSHPEDSPNGSLPLHLAAAAVGSDDHVDRVKVFLNSYPDAIKLVNEHQLLPMQIALIHGADYDVMKLLIDAYQPALEFPFLPSSETFPTEFLPLIGMLPFHIACCRNYSLDIIFKLLIECPDSLAGANRTHDLTASLEKLTM